MRHNHEHFYPEAPAAKKPYTRPSMTSVRLTPEEREEAGTSAESALAFALKLKAQGRL